DNMDLIDLFIGSEGTLGVVTSCSLDLQKAAFSAFHGLIFFSKEEQALEFVEAVKILRKTGAISPASLEFFDNKSLDLLREEYAFIPANCWAVYFEQEVEEKAQQEVLIEAWEKLLQDKGAILDKSILADTPKARERVFDFRHKLPQKINEFLRQYKQIKAASDIAVPEDKFKTMYNFYKDIAESSGLDYVNFGHIGESHLHFNFLPKNNEESQTARACLERFYRMAVSLGGTISAEHGIGKIKKPYLRIMYNEKEISEMASLKKYLDPDCLLGLDNIFDKELLI
ncbi:MAG: FAD-linked oxidase C-terminal domain-containing protein, partial [Candidatus Omnitrophica bacterium]|nr:FAD-linked oxidase C-terminal domain-containing protein [Candidatus Omnitrophota bacterium]